MTSQQAPLPPLRAIDRVPPEVWSKIFLFCLPDPGHRPCETSSNIVPLTLTHVCVAWARAAYSTSKLWSSLTIILKRSGTFPPIADAEMWLERSRSDPLTLAVKQLTFEPARRDLEGIIDLFVHYVSRWKHVRIHHNVPETIRAAGGDWSAPLLESLELIPNVFGNADMPADLSTLLGATPALKSLRFSGSGAPPPIPIPWGQLTRLVNTNHCSIPHALHLGQSCPHLEDLTISLWGVDMFDNPPTIAIEDMLVHHRLRSLQIQADPGELSQFFHRATLPRLIELKIFTTSGYSGVLPMSVLDDFLERSGAKLEVYTVVGASVPCLAGVTRNPNLESLVELTIRELTGDEYGGPRLSFAHLRSLIWGRDGKDFFLPNLRSLRLGGSHECWKHVARDLRDMLTEIQMSRRCPPADRPCTGFSWELSLGEGSGTHSDKFDGNALSQSDIDSLMQPAWFPRCK